MSKVRWIKAVTRFFISIIRGTPLMLQLIIIFYGPGLMFGPGYGFKEITLFGYTLVGSERMLAAVVAFTINYAAYFSEIFRGGIESIPKGQYEAGQVLGMTKGQIFKKIVLMQVVKRVMPPVSNEVITLVKDTALSRVIGVIEIIKVADMMVSKAIIWPLFYAGVFYLAFVGLLTILFNFIEKKLSYYKV
jgi:polar amino acid transport system permease protein